jgi:microcystin-dependent protein
MAIRQRIYFFDPISTDRFKMKHIPTEATMLDFTESVPFIKEVTDRSQLDKAGIAKTTTNAKVNTRDDSDAAGISPSGFTTFVKPSQIPKVYNIDGSVTVTPTLRGGLGADADILDYLLEVNFPVIPIPEDTGDLETEIEHEIRGFQGILCQSLAQISEIVPPGSPLTTLLSAIQTKMDSIVDTVSTIAAKVCENTVDLGDVVMTTLPSSAWSSKWLEPNGQSLATASYPTLFAVIGYNYGGAGANFNLPNLTTGSKYLRARQGPANSFLASSGGSNTYTLNNTNIPLHTHTFSGNTNSDGAHTHTIPTDNALGTGNVARSGDNQDASFNLASGGAHAHAFSGTTDGYGQNPPTAITIEPQFNHVYLKMRVL